MKLPEIDASFSDMDNDEVEVIKDDPEGTALATEAEQTFIPLRKTDII